MADIITQTNAKLFSSFTLGNIWNVIGWIIFILVLVGGGIFAYIYYRNKKQFNKRITACEIVNGYFQPVLKDMAKVVKLGKGGFEILYLKKLKTWKIAYGGRVGRKDYYFFILPDGYWYNGMMSGNLGYIDKNGGLIQVTTTNPSMRSQYTSLEKQIDSIHDEKKSWLREHIGLMVGMGFVLLLGVVAWLIFREISPILSGLSAITEKLGFLMDRMNTCSGGQIANTGLVPAA